MLQNMGSAGWAAFPAGTSLELKADGQKSGAQTPQGDMLDRADKQCDLLVLGQTLTTDTGGMGAGGGSHALGQVHADVRSGIIDAAAKFTAGILEQQLIPAILRLNYGDTEEAPTLHLQPVTSDNLQEKAAILAQLHAAGAGSIIPLDWLGKTFGIPKPKDGEATLADAKQGAAAAIPDTSRAFPKSVAARLAQLKEDALWAFNPNHDPHDGRFTFGPSGSAGPNGPSSEDEWKKKFPTKLKSPHQPSESACVPSGFAMAVLYPKGIIAPTYDEFIALEKQAEQAINPKSDWKQVGPMHNMSIRYPQIAPQFGVIATPFATDDWSEVAKMASPTTPVMATQSLGGGKTHQLVITGADDAGNLTGWDPKGETFTNQQKTGINVKSFVQIKASK